MLKKIILIALVFLTGTIVFGIVKDIIGYGQYIVAGALVYILYRIWKKPAGDLQ